ncbi:MAG: type II toxin-antitoxin system HicA family toxin [Planctomycetota bacterium]
MKRRDLEKYLKSRGCEFLRRGGEHDMWINPAKHCKGSVPRHREIVTPTLKNICRQLQIPYPPNV